MLYGEYMNSIRKYALLLDWHTERFSRVAYHVASTCFLSYRLFTMTLQKLHLTLPFRSFFFPFLY